MKPLGIDNRPGNSVHEFEELVNLYYRDLYRFGLSLTRSEADAADLTQQTFYIWANKGHQLRVNGSVKRWLLTTLHREFLQLHRRQEKFNELTMEEMLDNNVIDHNGAVSGVDVERMIDCLAAIPETYRAPLVLYYLEDLAYKEIAEVLELPLGTVQSRIARAKTQLLQMLDGEHLERKKEPCCG
jgi:RNA polymerase sigma-70 factor (ECF subfamily)